MRDAAEDGPEVEVILREQWNKHYLELEDKVMRYGEPVWTVKERQETLRKQYIAYLVLQVIFRILNAAVLIVVCLGLWAAIIYGLQPVFTWIAHTIWR